MNLGMVGALRAILNCERPRPHGIGLPLWPHQRRYLLATMLGVEMRVGLPVFRQKPHYPDPLDSVLYGMALAVRDPKAAPVITTLL